MLQIATQKFVVLTHFLMDVIPVVTTLNQFFQKEDIDLPLVKVSCLIKVSNTLEEDWSNLCFPTYDRVMSTTTPTSNFTAQAKFSHLFQEADWQTQL